MIKLFFLNRSWGKRIWRPSFSNVCEITCKTDWNIGSYPCVCFIKDNVPLVCVFFCVLTIVSLISIYWKHNVLKLPRVLDILWLFILFGLDIWWWNVFPRSCDSICYHFTLHRKYPFRYVSYKLFSLIINNAFYYLWRTDQLVLEIDGNLTHCLVNLIYMYTSTWINICLFGYLYVKHSFVYMLLFEAFICVHNFCSIFS